MSRRRPTSQNGFSLLEVVLALGILTASLAVLGELVRLGVRNAEAARDLTQAQLLCESKLAEVVAGIAPAEVVTNARFDLAPEWLYSITIDTTDQEGLLIVQVTVRQDLSEGSRPLEFSLVRWLRDPGTIGTTGETEGDAATAGGASE